MSTRYRLEVTQEGVGFTADLSVIDDVIDTWETVHPRAWGDSTGRVASWGTGDALLTHSSGSITLFGLTKKVEPGVKGKGEKQTAESGQLQDGEFTWKCVEKT